MNDRLHRIIVFAVSIVLFVFAISIPAFACSGVYVGKNASADGSRIIARTEDAHPLFGPKYMQHVPASSEAGRVITQTMNKFRYELPAHTYAYNAVPNCDCMIEIDGRYGACCINEKGVSVEATVTAYNCDAAKKSDPNAEDGLREESMADIVAACADTAENGIRIIASIIDKYGSNEQGIVMVMDEKEAWYMEIYSGHQYAAVKLPDDKVAAFGNEFRLESLKGYEKTIVSKELLSLPIKEKFAEYDGNGDLDLTDTYAGRNRLTDYSNMRTWYAYHELAPSQAGEYLTLKKYPFLYKPDKKVKLSQVMQLFRSRYEGTEYCPDENGREDIRVIGTETQQDTHIVQLYDDLPVGKNTVSWITLSQAECNLFVPVFCGMTDFIPQFKYSMKEYVMTDKSAYSIFKKLNTLCAVDRSLYKDAVVEYWENAQEEMIRTVPGFMKGAKSLEGKELEKYYNDYGKKVERSAIADAQVMSNDVLTAMAENTDTLKYKFTYKTLQLATEKTKPKKAEVSLEKDKISDKYGN